MYTCCITIKLTAFQTFLFIDQTLLLKKPHTCADVYSIRSTTSETTRSETLEDDQVSMNTVIEKREMTGSILMTSGQFQVTKYPYMTHCQFLSTSDHDLIHHSHLYILESVLCVKKLYSH